MFNDERDWFFEKRFGMFIHWGIYAISGWQEQEQYRRRLPRAEYTPLMNKFNREIMILNNGSIWLKAPECAIFVLPPNTSMDSACGTQP